MNIVTMTRAVQHTELLDLEFLPMLVQYPSHRLVDLDDADGRTPLRRTDRLLNMLTTITRHRTYPGIIELNETLAKIALVL